VLVTDLGPRNASVRYRDGRWVVVVVVVVMLMAWPCDSS